MRPFNSSLPMLLMRAREAVMQRFRPHLRRHRVTEQQWRILRALAECADMEMQDISDRCCIAAPSLSRTVPMLVRRGLVQRRIHPVDQRRVVVSLGGPGRALFKSMSEESERIYGDLTSEVGDLRMKRLYAAIEDFIATTGDAPLSLP